EIGTQYPDFLAGSLDRAERLSSFAFRTVRAKLGAALPKNFPKRCGATWVDAQGHKRGLFGRFLGPFMSTGIRGYAFCPTFTAATPARIRLGTPATSNLKFGTAHGEAARPAKYRLVSGRLNARKMPTDSRHRCNSDSRRGMKAEPTHW